MKGIWKRIVLFVRPFLRLQMIVSCAIPFVICDILPIFLLAFGTYYENAWLISISSAWLIFLRTPLGMESIVVIPCGLWIHRMLFKNDWTTRYRLLRLMVQAKKDWRILKYKVRYKRWENKNG